MSLDRNTRRNRNSSRSTDRKIKVKKPIKKPSPETERSCTRSPSPPKKVCPPKRDPPTLEGEFNFKRLEKNARYVISINEFNDVGRKCKYVGGFFNPNNLKAAPGVKAFKADDCGKFEKSFKNLPLAITTRNSIINRSCLLKKVTVPESCSDSENDHKHKKQQKEFTKCAVITWGADF